MKRARTTLKKLPTTAKNLKSFPPQTEYTANISDSSRADTDQRDAALSNPRPLAASRALQNIINHGRPEPSTTTTARTTARMSATHQAAQHAMHPDALLLQPFPSENNSVAINNKLHTYIAGYHLRPVRLFNSDVVTFALDNATILESAPDNTKNSKASKQQSSSRFIRLRCCKIAPAKQQFVDIWPTTEGWWPSHQDIHINKQRLNKQSDSKPSNKPLPSSVTLQHDMLRPVNKLTITKGSKKDQGHRDYVVAVEIIDVKSRQNIVSNIKMLPQAVTKQDIIAKQTVSHKDHGVEVLASDLSMSLIDPHSGLNFNTLVRSTHCRHLECFDLDNFLSQHVVNGPPESSAAICWRCPICRVDARPQFLVQDGYFTTILGDLKKSGDIDSVHVINFAPDGSWSKKKQKRKSTENDRPAKRREVIVID